MLKAILAALVPAACGGGQEQYFTSYQGKAPPELASAKEDWFNAAVPLTLAQLKGRPVWLEFSFIN
jgi:hypothetical protein